MLKADEIVAQCSGRWFSIYEHFGIDVGIGLHQPCPLCQGVDRFRIERDGSAYYCNGCNPGTALTLVQKYLGITFPETLERIQKIIGGGHTIKMDTGQNNKMSEADVKKMLNKVWTESIPLTGDDPASKYLKSRGLILQPDNVRYCEKCYESDSKTFMPAMVCRIQNHEGKPVSLHRLYLGETGKADIEKPKKLMPGTEVLRGCAVRLFSPEDPRFEDGVLGICEGVETAMSAAQGQGIATWAAISSTILETWQPPKNIREVIIFGDNDTSFCGQKSAYLLANRLYLKDLIVTVQIPEERGTDWNDVLIKQKG